MSESHPIESLIWPEPIWPIELAPCRDWPDIRPEDMRDYFKSPWTEQEQRYNPSGLEKLSKFGLWPSPPPEAESE